MPVPFTHYALAAGLLALAATSPALAQTKVKTTNRAGKPKTVATSPKSGAGLSRADLDPSASPCDNFYQYANGGWLKKNPIPAAETSWGTGAELMQRNRALVHRILDKAAANRAAQPGSNLQKVGDFYGSAMDTAAIEAAGLKYLQPHLDRIAAVQDLAGMQRLLADPKTHLGNSWYGYGVAPDAKQSDVYAVYAYQGGLTLPDRDYYLQDNTRSKAIRAAYQTYLVNTFKLLGDSPATAEQNAATVQRLETRLAQASRSNMALRDPQQNYNKLTVAQAHQDYPNLNLPLALQQVGLGAAQTIIVGQPEFLQEVNAMLGAEPLADQKTYLRWHLATDATPALPQAFGDESFRFSQTLTGAQQPEPRWRRSLAVTDQALGEAFGQLYVQEAFSPAAKVRAKQMVENLRQAYAERIRATDWMSPETKTQALQKLQAIAVKIGYPDKWMDYSSLPISRESYLNNWFAAGEFWGRDNYRHYGQPIDRAVWGMTPPTVNAYYNALYNEIVFPAGVLQPPFFDPHADDAVNYGATGVVIGHEITHGFDDQGRQYDAQGNLRDWWTKEDSEKFMAKTAVVGKQYDAFTPLDSVHINGQLTMGENLADIGGLTIAYQAFQKTQQAKEGQLIDGFTPNQRFFLAFALRYRRNQRPEDVRQQVQTDPHSPSQYRVLGALMNMPEFYQAFGCQDGNKMVRSAADRSRIW